MDGSGDESGSQRRENKTKDYKDPNALDTDVDKIQSISIEETETITLFNMPSVKETDEESPLIKRTQDYRDLLQNKIGSDSFNNRAAQTFNLTLKPKEITFDISHVSKSDNQQQQRDLFSYRMVTTRDQSL